MYMYGVLRNWRHENLTNYVQKYVSVKVAQKRTMKRRDIKYLLTNMYHANTIQADFDKYK